MTTTPPAPTVTAVVDTNPCPRVTIVITPMPADAAAMTVWRYAGGRREIVRGASNVPVAGDSAVIDYWVPLGVGVTYVVQTVNAAGTPSQVSPATAQLVLDSPYLWLSDPLDPRSSLPVALSSASGMPIEARFGSLRTATYQLAATLAPVYGSDMPLGFADVRQAPSGVPLELRTFDLDTFALLLALLQQAYPLCVRAGAAVPLVPGVLYLSIPAVTPTLDTDNVTMLWQLTGDSIAQPGTSVIVPARTYDDLGDEASSYDGLAPLYPSYVALQLG